MKHVELFAGIGGFRQALTLLQKDFGLEQETIAFSEIDANAKKTYKAAFDTADELDIGDIVAFTDNSNNVKNMPDFELLTGGFPCQSFSVMGKQKGFEDIRGNVFFKILDVLKCKKPKFILLENVRNIISHNNGKTFEYIITSLKDCGYNNVYYDIFNTEDFGLAQKRNRVFIFATTIDRKIIFKSKDVKKVFSSILEKTSLLKQKNTHEVLERKADAKYYLSSTIKPTILSNGTKSYRAKSEINPLIAKPLTATMVKMHRACQDNYFSDGYIDSKDPKEYLSIHYSKEELAKQPIRKLTPKEAFLLQGFDIDYISKIFKAEVSQAQFYKQAGNAVSVNTDRKSVV